ncbi:MAG TPA: DUF3343 domain-containing protein [Syntrophomonadaceae bacterium]|nr:DUF3343 domain-containing protein [Syntrophomonadaceae bacterium]
MNEDAVDQEMVTATVLTFPSSHHAFRAEKICQEAGIPVMVIPLPGEIRSDCGVALLLSPKLREKAEMLLHEGGVALAGGHEITREKQRARLWQRVLGTAL